MPDWGSFDEFLTEAQTVPPAERQTLVNQLLAERPAFPWINDQQATFIYARPGAENVALNMDIIKQDPPFLPMKRLEGSNLFYVTYTFQNDDLLDYLFAVNDPMTPLALETDLPSRVEKFWKPDPHNPIGMQSAQMDVSVLQMPEARPFPDWSRMPKIKRGSTIEHSINSRHMGVTGRKVWVHLPPNYEGSGLMYPLLILQDGQWMIGPLQVPHIADTLLKHGRLAPIMIAMVQSGSQQDRIRDYVSNDGYYAFVMTELLPFLQSHYRIDSTRLGIGGASAGGIAAADAALKNPAVFNALMMLSPPLGKGPAQEKLKQYLVRFEENRLLPNRIFHAVGRYEAKARFLRPNWQLADILAARSDTAYRFQEVGSGHGLTTFRSIMPEALSWAFPGVNS